MKPISYNFPKILNLQSKGSPLGDLNNPKATFEQQLLFFLLCLLKDSEHVRMKYAPKHFESTFGSAYFKPNKTKLKLAKTVKKEPRKASFPWDLGFLFVQPMKYALIFKNIKFSNRERKSNACDLQVFFKFSCKKTISLKLDLECL